MTRYKEAFSWPSEIQAFLESVVKERPLLNVCSGRSKWGDITYDKYEPADFSGEWTKLPFADDSAGAVFIDPPWDAPYKKECSAAIKEALRVAPVVYLMAPWIYGASWAKLTNCWFRQLPGINNIVGLTRYERAAPEPSSASSSAAAQSEEVPKP